LSVFSGAENIGRPFIYFTSGKSKNIEFIDADIRKTTEFIIADIENRNEQIVSI